MAARFTVVVTLVSVLALGAAGSSEARAGDDPPAAGADPAAAPATVEDLVKDLGDTKFAVKRLDAATAAKDVQDPRLLAPLVKCLQDEHPDVRAAAIAALGARADAEQRKKAADALGSRMKSAGTKADLESERIAVAGALHDLAQVASIGPLLDGIETGMSTSEVDARCHAVGNIASPKAIEALIQFMSRGHRDGSGFRASAARALQYATGERAVNDPDHWRAWWKEREKSFDFQAAAERREKERDDKAAREARKNAPRKKGKKDGEGDGEGKGGEGKGGDGK